MHKQAWNRWLVLLVSATTFSAAQEPASFTTPPRMVTGETQPLPAPDAAGALDAFGPPTQRSQNLARLMRPTFSIASEWQTVDSGVSLASYTGKMQVPTYPLFGPPPPFVDFSFKYTDLNTPAGFDLPGDLYDYALGLSWMRKYNDEWLFRFMFSTAIATDGENTTSDAWQFRGGGFAMYRRNDQLTWIFGALALGRNDIPVVPAAGAVWQPHPAVRFDLTLPRPRVAILVRENELRQQWGYFGGGFSGGTWAYQRASGANDQLTFRDWRIVLGWESTPRIKPGMPFARGQKMNVEVGYVFAREFEFTSGVADVKLREAILLGGSFSF